jgi:glycosyltransferase involved in cell wall biosynthesis
VKKKRPKYSVLLPTHNRDDVVSYSIESVLNQSFKDYELLIVGDGCTDDTAKIVKEFMRKDKRVRWFPFKKGKGFGYGHRNTVLKKSGGKYIAFAAHDDLWFPDHLKIIDDFFEKYKEYEITYSRPLWIHPDGTIVPSVFNTNNTKAKKIFSEKHNEIPAQCVVHTRERTKEVGYLDDSLSSAADWDLWKRIIATDKDRKLGFISTPTTIHFRADWRTSDNAWPPNVQDIYEIIRDNYSNYQNQFGFGDKDNLQGAVWGRIKDDSEFVETLRDYAIKIMDAILYTYYLKAKMKNEQLKKDIDKITSTKGYRLLEAMRGFRDMFKSKE